MAAASMASISTGGSSADLRTASLAEKAPTPPSPRGLVDLVPPGFSKWLSDIEATAALPRQQPLQDSFEIQNLKKKREIPEGRKSAGGGCSGPGKTVG